MGLADLQQYYRQLILKEDSMNEKAEQEARDEGFDDFSSEEASGVKRAKKIMEAIKRKESYKDALDVKFEESEDIEKGTYPPRDTAAVATAEAKRRGETNFKTGEKGAEVRDTIAAAIDAKHGPGSYGRANWPQDAGKESLGGKDTKKAIEKAFPPALASLMSAAAGWAFSGDVAGTPGRMTPEQASEWERTLSAAERRNLERTMRSRMRRKSADTSLNKDAFESLQSHYKDSTDTYIQRTPIIQMLKDHSAVPPRQGLMWDAAKHRWTRPENVGHTVSEVQGKKRFRGTGTGAHERTVGGHGSGKTRGVERGRRFRGTTDAGVVRPHETKGAAVPKHSKKR
tara:strand:+ start:1793 stop:2818 length:1026 start_codon:yes stop_codon:yes gene_type:complete